MKKFSDDSLEQTGGDRIEAYLDLELEPSEHAAFEEALAGSYELREELELARSLRDELKSLPEKECPADVFESIVAHIESQPLPGGTTPPARESNWRWFGWFDLRLAAPALCALMAVYILAPWEEAPVGPIASPGEVAAAERQLEATFQYLAQVGVRTSARVGEEVLKGGVVEPVRSTARAIARSKTLTLQNRFKNQEG